MIGWLLWFFVAPLCFVLGGLLSSVLPFDVDVTAAVCLVLALHVRVGTIPGLLFCAALGRGLLVDGDLPLQFLALGLPIATLLPFRRAFERHSLILHCSSAAFLALTVPRVASMLGQLSGQEVGGDPGGVLSVLLAAVLVPPLALLLRSTPPLSLFAERSE